MGVASWFSSIWASYPFNHKITANPLQGKDTSHLSLHFHFSTFFFFLRTSSNLGFERPASLVVFAVAQYSLCRNVGWFPHCSKPAVCFGLGLCPGTTEVVWSAQLADSSCSTSVPVKNQLPGLQDMRPAANVDPLGSLCEDASLTYSSIHRVFGELPKSQDRYGSCGYCKGLDRSCKLGFEVLDSEISGFAHLADYVLLVSAAFV